MKIVLKMKLWASVALEPAKSPSVLERTNSQLNVLVLK